MKILFCSLLALVFLPALCISADLSVDFSESLDGTWIGPEFWANRLQDWRINDGRIECIDQRLAGRSVHLLTRRISPKKGDVSLSVKLGAINPAMASEQSAAGF